MKTHDEVSKYAKGLHDALPDRIQHLISWCNADLYYGPIAECDDIDNSGVIYPGFSEACAEITKATDHISEIYYDNETGYITDKEPEEGCYDENGEYVEYLAEWYHYERKDILKLVVGKELSSYL